MWRVRERSYKPVVSCIASSVSDFGPSPVAPQVATVDGAHHENGLGGPVAAGGPPTANAYIHGPKHHSKFRRRNERDHHSNGFVRPGEGKAVQSALESLQRHKQYMRATTDTSDRGARRGDAKRNVLLEK